ncbi:PD-(D/E)XK nuclease family protein [Leeuwenhoekiella sp. NPDC079379]|uniref:PD-(D/E)XK nuclease family protein n=1 Tax=Leeuwenhoekiella sp. NPDC079379 TaxID=3364122 RepID=UPI0037CA6E59
MSNLSKTIEDVALRLPSLPNIPRKNFFDILTIQRKETLNSKILAYFFDPNEDHAYGDLFKNALLAVIKSKTSHINGVFYKPVTSVVTEERTSSVKEEENRLKSIDIVLEGRDWCILIENKIDHLLNNPLNIYLEHAQSKKKELLCLVLSLELLNPKPGSEFINITHKELINEVRKEIPFDTSIPELDIFYLREYFKNIESHYFNLSNQPKMNDVVTALILSRKAVQDIEEKKKEAITFLDAEIKRVFETLNYKSYEVWFVHPKNENLAFWINDAKSILENNYVEFFFEVWHDLKEKTSEDEIHQKIIIEGISPCLSHKRVSDNKNRYKIVTFYEENFINSTVTFGDKLTNVLQDIFFSPNGIEEQALNKLNLGLEPALKVKNQ